MFLNSQNAQYNPNINDGLWVIMIRQCRFIDHNERTTLVWDVDSWDAVCVCVGVLGVGGNSLYFLLNSAVNLKLL